MRSVGVVVGPPFFDQPAGLRQIGEQVLVEALVAQPTVERLNEAVLHRLARCDVVPFDATFLLPRKNCGEFLFSTDYLQRTDFKYSAK